MKLEEVYFAGTPFQVCVLLMDTCLDVKRTPGLTMTLSDNHQEILVQYKGVTDVIPISGNVRRYRPMTEEGKRVPLPEPTESVTTTMDAPYGYKADGTPRKRPGRPRL